jgi:ABC-type uncharacterized transport system substrate-binding protein
MQRRKVLCALAGVAIAWPLACHTQAVTRKRHDPPATRITSGIAATNSSAHVGVIQKLTHTLPIVFVQVADAVGGGFVESMARPGGNATGFTNFEFDVAGKWLELLRQMSFSFGSLATVVAGNRSSKFDDIIG